MFDIGFSELLLIGGVALVVVGPERLPKLARTAGHLFGRMQRYVNDVKSDINREMEAAELKELKALRDTVEETGRELQSSMSAHGSEISDEIRKTENEFERLKNPTLHFGQADAAATTEPATPDAIDAEDASPQMELGLNAGRIATAEPLSATPEPARP
jgi:sec-independent protein translocase protein TatB